MIERPGDWRQLRLVDESWHRSYRRVRGRGVFRDPLGQGVVAVSSAILTAGSGVWFLLLGWVSVGGWLLGLAAIEATIFASLAARAFKRDKAVQFWQERRQLRIDLEREEAYRKVLLWAHLELRRFQSKPPSRDETERALGQLADLTFRFLAPLHDDLGVLAVEEKGRRCRIVHSALSQGSRWQALKAGKHCILEGDLSQRLAEIAGKGRVQQQFIGSSAFPVSFVILHESSLGRAEHELLQYLYPILETVANSASPTGQGQDRQHLRLVSATDGEQVLGRRAGNR
jgi:hypothetical protein